MTRIVQVLTKSTYIWIKNITQWLDGSSEEGASKLAQSVLKFPFHSSIYLSEFPNEPLMVINHQMLFFIYWVFR